MPSIVSMINMENDITYPPGVKGITDELPIEELVKRLKICAGVFQNFGQNDSVTCYENLALHIASEEFMNHSNKEVKLLTACIIADVFRVFAPDAPYREPALLKTIFLFFIEQLKGMKANTGLYFQRHFYLLEVLAWVKAFNICFDLDDGQEIFCKLFKLLFYLISDGQSVKVKNYMLDIMSALLVDIDNVSNELLEAILIWIIEPHKTQKKECFFLAKDLIKRTNNILEPYCQQYFTSVLFPDKEKDNRDIGHTRDGVELESDADAEKDNEIDQQLFGSLDKKSNKKKSMPEKINSQNPIYSKLHVYDFIHELYLIAPNLLVNVIPLLDFKLKSDKNDERLHVTRALGRMFSSADSNLASENPTLWKSFLGRFNDIEIPVRLACVQYSVHFLHHHPTLVGDIAEHMAPRAYDPDENVRHEVVAALVSACCPNTSSTSSNASSILGPLNISTTINPISPAASQNASYCPLLLSDDGKLMDCLRSRTLDKKFRIRKEALMGLGTIYKTAYALTNNGKQCQMAAPERLKLGWIRDQTMHAYYQNTTEDQILVERVFNTCIVPFNLSTPKRMYRLLHLFVNVDDHSLKALMEMWKKHFLLRTLATAYVELRLKSLETQPQNVNTLDGGGGVFTSDKGSSKVVASKSVAKSADSKLAPTPLPAVDEINTKLYQISKMLPDPIKSLDYMKRFDQELKSDPRVLKNLQTLLTETVSCKDACQFCKNILKRMGNPQASNQLYTNTKQFLERVAPLMIDPEAVICLCRILEEHETLVEVNNKSGIHPFYEGETCYSQTSKSGTGASSSSHSGTKATSAAQKASNDLGQIKERGFRLLQALSCVFGNCFRTPECIEILSNFLQSKDDKTCEFALQVLTNVLRTWHDIEKDTLGSLLQTLQKLCKGSNPKHAKYAINSIQALLAHDENKLKTINRSLLKLFGDYLKKTSDSVPYLMALSGLGQLALNRPEIASDIEYLARNLGIHLFPHYDEEEENIDSNAKQSSKGNSSLEKLVIPTDYWSSTSKDPVSRHCKARILYIKLRCKVLLGKQKMLQSQANPCNASDFLAETRAFYAFLFKACIHVKPPASEANKTSSARNTSTQALNDYILLKLKATFTILKMIQTVTFWEIFSVPQYQALARLISDVDCLEFRQKMVYKLHKGLFALKLPLEYLAILSLCYGEPNKELKARCKQYMAANIAKRREFLRTNPATYTSKIYAILPDYSLPYAIHLLAHSPHFSTKDDIKALESIKDALWFLIEPLMHKNENYSFSFFKKLIENIKQTKDAQNPTSIETNEKLYAVCDIALGLIWTRSSSFELKDFPGKPILPSKLFTQPMNAPNTQIYLPPQYAFSPAKKKVTRPDMNQFFSLGEDGKGSKARVQTKSARHLKGTLLEDTNENDLDDVSQEKEVAINDSITTTSNVDSRSNENVSAKMTESQDSAGPSSLCSSTPKNQSQNISSPFQTSLSKSPTISLAKPDSIVSVSNQIASPYPTPPLSSQEGQTLDKSPKIYPKRKRGTSKDVIESVHPGHDFENDRTKVDENKNLSGVSSDENSAESYASSDEAPKKIKKTKRVAKGKRSVSTVKLTKPKRK